jgi:hypothetical protein
MANNIEKYIESLYKKDNPVLRDTAQTYPEILEELVMFSQNPTYVEENFRDFYAGSAGLTLLELMSALGEWESRNVHFSRRETYIFEARLRTSLWNSAAHLGYVVNRTSAEKIKYKINNQISSIWNHLIPIGNIGGIPLSIPADATISTPQHIVEAYLGEWKTVTFTTDGESYQEFDILAPDIRKVDNNLIRIYVDNVEVDYTKYAEDLDTDNLLLITFGTHIKIKSGDGLGDTGIKLPANKTLTVNYLETKAPPTNLYEKPVSSKIGRFIPDTIEQLHQYRLEDSFDKVRTLAPSYHNAGRRMHTTRDHNTICSSYEGVASAVAQTRDPAYSNDPYRCCSICVNYVMYDQHILNSAEIQSYDAYLDQFKYKDIPFNFNPASPVRIDAIYDIVIKPGTDTTYIDSKIREYYDVICLKIGYKFNTGKPVRLINALPGVINVYALQPTRDRQLTNCQYFVLGDLTLNFTTDVEHESKILEFDNDYYGYTETVVEGGLKGCCSSVGAGANASTTSNYSDLVIYGVISVPSDLLSLNFNVDSPSIYEICNQ